MGHTPRTDARHRPHAPVPPGTDIEGLDVPTSTPLTSAALGDGATPMTRRRAKRSTRRIVAATVAFAFALVALAGCWSSSQQKVADLVNWSRHTNGLAALRADQLAMDRAQEWSNHMASTGQLAHRGTWSGLGSWCAAGENVGYGQDAATVHNALMRSAPHRANILGRYDRIGTGYAKRNGLVWVTQIFLRSC